MNNNRATAREVILGTASAIATDHCLYCADQGKSPNEVLEDCGLAEGLAGPVTWEDVVGRLTVALRSSPRRLNQARARRFTQEAMPDFELVARRSGR
ncbi:MAG: hypothetical protein ACPGOV_11725 [Magnetovibrionaceae bacterium]